VNPVKNLGNTELVHKKSGHVQKQIEYVQRERPSAKQKPEKRPPGIALYAIGVAVPNGRPKTRPSSAVSNTQNTNPRNVFNDPITPDYPALLCRFKRKSEAPLKPHFAK